MNHIIKIRIVGSLFFLLAFGDFSVAQNVEAMLREAENLETQFQERNALKKYEEALSLQPLQTVLLYKCSELSARIGAREKNKKNQQIYYSNALIYAQRLQKNFPASDLSYLALSIALGKQALTKSGKEKIQFVRDIRAYAEKAIQINPSNYKAWHVLGKWHYEVANLNFLETTMLKLVYGGLPDASFSSSIQAYERAGNLHSPFLLNELELAKAYHAKDNDKKALALLRHLLTLPNTTEDDPIIKNEASYLLKKWD